jgi:uncharacterized membrane protein (GlpM family)
VIRELVLRFVLGGAIVSLFSLLGDLWKPKTFSGIFGAAPSVALASLALAARQHGPHAVATLGRSMLLGAIALYVYASACVVITDRTRWPVWLAALCAWLAWFVVALGGLHAMRALGTFA